MGGRPTPKTGGGGGFPGKYKKKKTPPPPTTEIHTENQHLTLLVKPRVQPRFLHRLLILCFSCNPVIPKNKKSPKHFPFSVKIPIFASVPRAERSNAAKPAQLPNRYRLPNFLLFKSYLPTDYKKTIVFL